MEEGRHVAASLLAAVDARADDVVSYVGRYHAQQDELVSVSVPEGWVRVEVEVSLHNLSAVVTILSVHVAPEVREEEGAVESGVEHPAFSFRAAFHLNVSEHFVPDIVGLAAHLFEGLSCQFSLQVLFGILYADEREAYLQFQGLVVFGILEPDHSHRSAHSSLSAALPTLSALSTFFFHALDVFR